MTWAQLAMEVSIHVPLAEHDASFYSQREDMGVSIHVPLAEHDGKPSSLSVSISMFQFTCPSRSTTSIYTELR